MPATSAVELGDADDERFAVLERVKLAPAVGLGALAYGQFAHLGAAPEPLGGEQHAAVDDQEDRRELGLGRDRAQVVLERDAEDPGGNARDDDQPRQTLGAGLYPARGERVKEGADDPHPFAPIEVQQPERAADVEHHHERQPEGFLFGLRVNQLVPAEQRREQDRVPEARDREQLGGALQDSEHDRLEVRDGRGGDRQHGARQLTRAPRRVAPSMRGFSRPALSVTVEQRARPGSADGLRGGATLADALHSSFTQWFPPGHKKVALCRAKYELYKIREKEEVQR